MRRGRPHRYAGPARWPQAPQGKPAPREIGPHPHPRTRGPGRRPAPQRYAGRLDRESTRPDHCHHCRDRRAVPAGRVSPRQKASRCHRESTVARAIAVLGVVWSLSGTAVVSALLEWAWRGAVLRQQMVHDRNRGVRLSHACRAGLYDRFGPAGYLHFGEDVRNMVADRVWRQSEPGGYRGVGQAGCDQVEYLPLARG